MIRINQLFKLEKNSVVGYDFGLPDGQTVLFILEPSEDLKTAKAYDLSADYEINVCIQDCFELDFYSSSFFEKQLKKISAVKEKYNIIDVEPLR